jgi:dihydroxyacetone kinase-like protein
MLDLVDGWLVHSAERIHAEADALTRLDQAIGDGDHGANLDRGFTAILATVEAGRPSGEGVEAAAERLHAAGRTLISTVGGASGPLYGSALLRAAAAIRSAASEVSKAELVVLGLEAAGEGVSALGHATVGEKTMLDALMPAAEAARDALDGGGDVAGVASAAADAADAGAVATIPMLATKGRASYLGERSIGHQDPGATSAALILRALADALVD